MMIGIESTVFSGKNVKSITGSPMKPVSNVVPSTRWPGHGIKIPTVLG